MRADTVAVDGDVVAPVRVEQVFIDAAAGEDGHVTQSPLIEDVPYLACMLGKVAAVDAHTFDGDALAPQSWRQRDHLGRRGFRVIRVDEQDHRLRIAGGEVLEGGDLVVMRLNEGMGHGAVGRNIEQRAGRYCGRAGEAREVGGAGSQDTGLGAVGTTEPEVHQEFVGGGDHATRGLGGDHRLKMHQIDHAAFHQLRLR